MNILESGFRDGTLDMFYVKMWQWTGSNMTLPTCLRGNMQNSCLKYLNSWETVSKLRKKECSKGINLKVFTFLTSHWNPFQIFSKHSSSNLIESILIIKIIRPVPVKGNFQIYCSEMLIYETLGWREKMKINVPIPAPIRNDKIRDPHCFLYTGPVSLVRSKESWPTTRW